MNEETGSPSEGEELFINDMVKHQMRSGEHRNQNHIYLCLSFGMRPSSYEFTIGGFKT